MPSNCMAIMVMLNKLLKSNPTWSIPKVVADLSLESASLATPMTITEVKQTALQ